MRPVSDIATRLRAEAENAAVLLLGPPNSVLSSLTEFRWGQKGALRMHLHGQKRGKWADFSSDDHGDVLDLAARELCGMDRALKWAVEFLGNDFTVPPARLWKPPAPTLNRDEGRLDTSLRLWGDAGPFRNSPGEAYVENRCGPLDPSDDLDHALRFHGQTPFKVRIGEAERTIYVPALIALLRNATTGFPQAVQRIAILPDGSAKAAMPDGTSSKKALGPAAGAVAMLDRPEDVTMGLGIAEGIETAMSVRLTGWRPVWATCGAGTMKKFPRLAGLDAVTIFADADKEKDGKRPGDDAAEVAANRLARQGIEVRVIAPAVADRDWNDELSGAAQ